MTTHALALFGVLVGAFLDWLDGRLAGWLEARRRLRDAARIEALEAALERESIRREVVAPVRSERDLGALLDGLSKHE
ncbi:MAG: hypothetical protein KDI98_03990 [Hyphomicrobiaceae bacterium]|nr:hypothetical protein [Hyphomicrobiaceae bacterium]